MLIVAMLHIYLCQNTCAPGKLSKNHHTTTKPERSSCQHREVPLAAAVVTIPQLIRCQGKSMLLSGFRHWSAAHSDSGPNAPLIRAAKTSAIEIFRTRKRDNIPLPLMKMLSKPNGSHYFRPCRQDGLVPAATNICRSLSRHRCREDPILLCNGIS